MKIIVFFIIANRVVSNFFVIEINFRSSCNMGYKSRETILIGDYAMKEKKTNKDGGVLYHCASR